MAALTLDPQAGEVLVGTRRWCVICADNREVLPLLPAKSVAHVITDPPYEAEAHTLQRRIKANTDGKGSQAGGGDTRGVRFEPVTFDPMTEALRDFSGQEFARLASRWILVFCQAEASHKWAASVTRGGARYRRTNIWVKPDAQPQLNGLEPAQGYESICLCHSKAAMRWNGGGRVGVFVHCTARTDGPKIHDTAKPISLMLELVSLFTEPGDLVLDPYSGSATTGAACLRLGRRFIGIEANRAWAEVSRERLAAEAQGLNLQAARADQLPMFPGETP